MRIEICKNCNGEGKITINVGVHISEYEQEICTKCNGTGRVKTSSYTYTVPFDISEEQIHEIDSQIVNLIRKLESDNSIPNYIYEKGNN